MGHGKQVYPQHPLLRPGLLLTESLLPTAGGSQGERPLQESRADEGGKAAAASPIPPADEPALTLASMPPEVLHQILLQLEEPADLGRAACVSRQLKQAVAPLAPALFHYSLQGDAARVQELLGQPSVLEGIAAAHTPDKITALHTAAAMGRTEIVSALIEHGAPIDALSLEQWTPIMCAALGPRWHHATVEMLSAAGAVVEAGSAPWTDALKEVARGGDYLGVDLLLTLGVPPEPECALHGAGGWCNTLISTLASINHHIVRWLAGKVQGG